MTPVRSFTDKEVEAIPLLYPKAFKKLFDFLMEIFGTDPDFYEKTTEEERKRAVIGVLLFNPRMLFDFFDSEDKVISVFHRDESFFFEVNGTGGARHFEFRTEAEIESFKEAFKQLEA